MGFRDIESFNLALLTKHAWRITTNLDLLLSKILKAKYFPRSSFFLAELGERPSLTWRSILSTKTFLKAGLRRRIGNGASTPITDLGDGLACSEGARKLITSRPIHSNFPNVVSDLIDWSRGAWVIEVLKQHLWPCDVERVLQVPIGTLTSIDGSYWFFSNHEKFTVMSCYYCILGQAPAANTSPSRSSNILSMKEWKWMWGLQTTPKNSNFFMARV